MNNIVFSDNHMQTLPISRASLLCLQCRDNIWRMQNIITDPFLFFCIVWGSNCLICMRSKLVNRLVPNLSVIPVILSPETPKYNTRQVFNLPHFRARADLFNNSFLPSTVRLWNELPWDIRNSASLPIFKSKLLKLSHRCNKLSDLYNFANR